MPWRILAPGYLGSVASEYMILSFVISAGSENKIQLSCRAKSSRRGRLSIHFQELFVKSNFAHARIHIL